MAPALAEVWPGDRRWYEHDCIWWDMDWQRVNRHEERAAHYAYFGKREVAPHMAERWAYACAVRIRHEILTDSRRLAA